MQLVAAMHEHQRTTFGLTARSILRQGWQQALSDRLRQLPRKTPEDWYGGGEVDHPSTLIRRIAPKRDFGTMHFDASDILVVRYLGKLPAARGLSFGLADWVARELRDPDGDDGTDDEHAAATGEEGSENIDSSGASEDTDGNGAAEEQGRATGEGEKT